MIFLPPHTPFLLPQLYEAFTFLKGLGAVILVHAENGDLIAQVSGMAVHRCHSGPRPRRSHCVIRGVGASISEVARP